MLQLVKKIDFDFDFATTGTMTAGSTAETGDNANYDVYDGIKWTNEYSLDEQSIGEIAGIELLGPISALGVRDKVEYVRLRINGEEYKHINMNEMMAPPYSAYEPNNGPFFGGKVRIGDQYENLPHSFCHNIGKPMLLGGDPVEAVPKVGPGETISIEVKAPRAAQGGATISNKMIVRLSVVQARGIDMVQKLGTHYGWLSGSAVDQNFVFRDMEVNGDIEEYTVSKSIDMTESGQGFQLDDWTELYGGLNASKPYVYPYIRYANNAVATTTNEEYVFTKVGSKVLQDEQVLDWNFTKSEAIKLDHVGVTPHANHKYTRMFINGRDSNPYAWTPDSAINEYPMPAGRTQPPLHYKGPAALGRGAIVWNTKANLGIIDDGTSIPAWAATPVRGSAVAVWGKYYRFN